MKGRGSMTCWGWIQERIFEEMLLGIIFVLLGRVASSQKKKREPKDLK